MRGLDGGAVRVSSGPDAHRRRPVPVRALRDAAATAARAIELARRSGKGGCSTLFGLRANALSRGWSSTRRCARRRRVRSRPPAGVPHLLHFALWIRALVHEARASRASSSGSSRAAAPRSPRAEQGALRPARPGRDRDCRDPDERCARWSPPRVRLDGPIPRSRTASACSSCEPPWRWGGRRRCDVGRGRYRTRRPPPAAGRLGARRLRAGRGPAGARRGRRGGAAPRGGRARTRGPPGTRRRARRARCRPAARSPPRNRCSGSWPRPAARARGACMTPPQRAEPDRLASRPTAARVAPPNAATRRSAPASRRSPGWWPRASRTSRWRGALSEREDGRERAHAHLRQARRALTRRLSLRLHLDVPAVVEQGADDEHRGGRADGGEDLAVGGDRAVGVRSGVRKVRVRTTSLVDAPASSSAAATISQQRRA